MTGGLTPAQFERFARRRLAGELGMFLTERQVAGVPKRFDFVSPDGSVVGDAKYYTLVRGKKLPPAKFSVIAEHAWLLEKTEADQRFLLFGNDIRVPQMWLERYAALADGTSFLFLSDEGQLRHIHGPQLRAIE